MYDTVIKDNENPVKYKMFVKIVLASLVLCAVVEFAASERGYCNKCHFIPNRRIKRGKYPGPPQRFYSRPPVSFPHLGAISYTPPPNYKVDDDLPYPGNRPYKVSKRPTNDGLGDEDINNLMKYLTTQDLNKIVEFANQKQKEENYNKESPYEKFNNEYNRPKKNNGISFFKVQDTDDNASHERYQNDINKQQTQKEGENIFKATVQEVATDQKYFLNDPYQEQKANEYNTNSNYRTEPTPMKYFVDISNNNNQAYSSEPQQSELHTYNKQKTDNGFQNSALKPEEYTRNTQTVDYTNQTPSNDGASYFVSDTKLSEEELLPKPINLREEPDFEGSFTNNVPITIRADSYKVENFGELPLMNFNSKLDTVSSYHVPHYTVTTSKSQAPSSLSSSSPSAYGKVPVEPAPPVSAAKEQSDAHLKAIKIWSHRSKGTAYTLHNDGTLSLEKPLRPKYSYGYP